MWEKSGNGADEAEDFGGGLAGGFLEDEVGGVEGGMGDVGPDFLNFAEVMTGDDLVAGAAKVEEWVLTLAEFFGDVDVQDFSGAAGQRRIGGGFFGFEEELLDFGEIASASNEIQFEGNGPVEKQGRADQKSERGGKEPDGIGDKRGAEDDALEVSGFSRGDLEGDGAGEGFSQEKKIAVGQERQNLIDMIGVAGVIFLPIGDDGNIHMGPQLGEDGAKEDTRAIHAGHENQGAACHGFLRNESACLKYTVERVRRDVNDTVPGPETESRWIPSRARSLLPRLFLANRYSSACQRW